MAYFLVQLGLLGKYIGRSRAAKGREEGSAGQGGSRELGSVNTAPMPCQPLALHPEPPGGPYSMLCSCLLGWGQGTWGSSLEVALTGVKSEWLVREECRVS